MYINDTRVNEYYRLLISYGGKLKVRFYCWLNELKNGSQLKPQRNGLGQFTTYGFQIFMTYVDKF